MLKPNQQAAIKKLEAALLSVKRAGLVLVGIDDVLHITVEDAEFVQAALASSHPEAMTERNNSDHPNHHRVKHYGCYRDSGAT